MISIQMILCLVLKIYCKRTAVRLDLECRLLPAFRDWISRALNFFSCLKL